MTQAATLPAMNPVLGTEVPLLQWSSGKTMMRTASGKGRFVGTVGFHSEAGRYDDFDEACAAAGIGQAEIQHQSGETKTHWGFGESLAVFPVTAGPVITSVFRLKERDNALRTAQAGLGMRWTTDQQGRPRSQVAVRCLLPALVEHDHRGLVQLVASSTMSDRLAAALADHVRVCHVAARELGKPLFPAELQLPLGPGPEVTVGKTQQMTLVPFVSQHPKTVTPDYIEGIHGPSDLPQTVGQLWEAVVSWAMEYTLALPDSAPAPAPAPAKQPAEDLYLPGAEDAEQVIKQTDKLEHLEAIRQHLLDLRERSEISTAEQMRLAQLIEQRMDEVSGLI